MNRFSIKDIENLTGIKAHTIRIWEQRYGILQPKRTPTNIRYYDAHDLKYALRVALLNNYGYKISRIHEMTDTDISGAIQRITDKDFQLKMVINELLEITLTMDTDRFEGMIDLYISKYGIEEAVETLLFNFLEKLGIMWMTDRIYPAQEHMVSNIIYRKIAVALEKMPPKRPTASPSVLLFLPEGEVHDIGLMYVYYMLRKFGKDPIYLGPNSPLKEVQMVAEARNPQYVFVHLTSVAFDFDCNRYLKKLSDVLPETNILVSGSMLQHAKLHNLKRVKTFRTLEETRSYLHSL